MCVALRGLANPAAEQAVRDADAKIKKNDFVGAAAKFREAYAADGKPEYLCDVGVAYNKAKTELPRAQLFLGRCNARSTVLDPKFVASMRAALASVEKQLQAGKYTPVDISVDPPSARVEVSAFLPDEAFVGPRAIWLPYGKHRVTFSAEGYTSETVDVEATSQKGISVSITLKRPVIEVGSGSGTGSGSATDTGSGSGSAAAGSGSGVAEGSGAGSGSAIIEAPPPVRAVSRPSKIPPIIATVVTGALVVGATITFANANDRSEIASFALDKDTFQRDKDYVSKQNRYTIAMASLGFVGAGISGYLWYRALHAPSTHVEVNATGSGAGVSVTGRF
jgi:hypothetical protein